MKKSIIKSGLFWAVVGLALFRIVTLGAAAVDIPYSQALVDPVGWWENHGGDDKMYFRTAQDLLVGQSQPGNLPVGFPLVMIPFILAFDAHSLGDIAVPLVLFHALIVFPIVTSMVYVLAKHFFSRTKDALLIAGLFVAVPYLFYIPFALLGADSLILQEFLVSRFKQLNFYFIGSDPIGTVAVLGSLLLFLSFSRKKNYHRHWSILGLVTGFSIVTRMQNIVLAPVYLLLLCAQKRFRASLWYIVGLLPFGILQMWLNMTGSGSLFGRAYSLYKGENNDIPMVSLSYIGRLVRYPLDHGPVLIVGLILVVALMVVGVRFLYRRKHQETIILASYTFGILSLLLILEPTLRNPRYFLPIIPSFLIFGYASLLWFAQLIRSYGK